MKAIDKIDKIEDFVSKERDHWKEKMVNNSGYDLVEATARFSECTKVLAVIVGLRNSQCEE